MNYKERWNEWYDAALKFFGLRAFVAPPRAVDPYNIYLETEDPNDKRALRVAMFVTLFFHLLLFVVRFAAQSAVFFPDNIQMITLKNLAGPPVNAGGGAPKAASKRIEIPKPKPQPLPFPDPTPDEPEPLYEPVVDAAPDIVAQIGTELSLGDISGPPGSGGRGGTGQGGGMGSGIGPGSGPGVYSVGGGVSSPIPIVQPLPLYTEEARKARIEGIVLLQAIIRKDGSVDSFRVIRGLGYGLDESAINTIATKWRFKPGMLSGQPVDVQANIEVTFRLY